MQTLPDLPGIALLQVQAPALVVGLSSSARLFLGIDASENIEPLTLGELIQGGDQLLSRADPAGGEFVLRALRLKLVPGEITVDLTARVERAGKEGGERVWLLALTDSTARTLAESELQQTRQRLADLERQQARLTALQEAQSSVAGLAEGEAPAPGGDQQVMVGASPALRRVKEQVLRVARTSATVLIHGETGAGKELVARSIHHLSDRKSQAFVAVNCAALPESLIESELFGHERGAFTGADKRRAGKFELADGGTLFLDEIAELPLQSQAKLLRVLQDGAFERVGGVETLKVDVRLVAATHRDLARQVERVRFREDLFYRLNVFKIEVPPLRDRREDLKPLVEHLHERAALRMGKSVLRMSDRSLRRLMAYGWPGNVRELANAVERATLLSDGNELEIEIPESPLKELPGVSMGPAGGTREGTPGTRDILLDLTLEQLQRLHITHALESCGYRVFGADGAAAKLDLHPSTLLSRMDKYGIPRPRLMKRERKGGLGA